MIGLSRARPQIPGFERKWVWIRGLAGEDLGTFPLSVCLETFNSRGGGVGNIFVGNLNQQYYFFLTKNIFWCDRKNNNLFFENF